MATATFADRGPTDLPEADRRAVQQARAAVARLAGRGAVRVEAVPVRGPGPVQRFVLPAAAVRLLTDMLGRLGAGTPVMVAPDQAELTTQQAADFLNVSRPHVIKLMEQGALPYRKVGTHRRMFAADLRAYKDGLDTRRRAALERLVAEAQAAGTYE